jgi:hypothetical protein
MSLDNALTLVDQRWAKDFESFVETGDASDEFFAFLDSDENCQKAVDQVLKRKSQGLERVSELLRSEEPIGRNERPTMKQTSARIADALGAAARLPAAERTQVVKDAVVIIQNAMEDSKPVEAVASALAHEVGVSRR